MNWDAEADKLMEGAPRLIRPLARRRVEEQVRRQGRDRVTRGDVEAARADNRQRLPVGAAYLRESSELLSRSILPAAGRLYETEATRLNADYRSGTATATLVAFLAGGFFFRHLKRGFADVL